MCLCLSPLFSPPPHNSCRMHFASSTITLAPSPSSPCLGTWVDSTSLHGRLSMASSSACSCLSSSSTNSCRRLSSEKNLNAQKGRTLRRTRFRCWFLSRQSIPVLLLVLLQPSLVSRWKFELPSCTCLWFLEWYSLCSTAIPVAFLLLLFACAKL